MTVSPRLPRPRATASTRAEKLFRRKMSPYRPPKEVCSPNDLTLSLTRAFFARPADDQRVQRHGDATPFSDIGFPAEVIVIFGQDVGEARREVSRGMVRRLGRSLIRFSARPILGYANYRMPISGLYLCGSDAHPGGGVTGAPGHNAAQAVIADLMKKMSAVIELAWG